MVHDSVKYKKLPSETHDDQEITLDEQPSDDEVTVYLQQPSDKPSGPEGRRETWIRLGVALVLLCIVLGFVLCEYNGCGSESASPELQNPQSDHSHHRHGDGDEDEEEHNEEEGHDSHDTDVHRHSHPGSLYHHAVVITDSANCSRIGSHLLQSGGNVVDAGIAALLCLGVVHPHSAGIGGMFSAILYNHTLRTFKAIQPSFPEASQAAHGIPETLQEVLDLHSQYGRSAWKGLFEGAIRLAKDGFRVDDILSRALETHKERVLRSKLCDLFCDPSGRLKTVGSFTSNRNLSELLLSVSLNKSRIPETLAMKLAEDLSPSERPDSSLLQRCGAEINDPLITQGEKYTVFSSSSPLAAPMLSDILGRVREQSLPFRSDGDLNSTAGTYKALLNLAGEIYSDARSGTKLELRGAANMDGSSVGVLDSHGNVLVLTTSLNSTWGCGRFSPSSGVVLSDFTTDLGTSPHLGLPLVIKIKEEEEEDDGSDDDDDDDDAHHHEDSDHPHEDDRPHHHHREEEEESLQLVAVTGSFSSLFQAVAILTNRLEHGASAEEAVRGPLLQFVPGEGTSLSGCLTAGPSGWMLTEDQEKLQAVQTCPASPLAVLLQLHAGHVGAYGSPVANAHTDGY